LLTSVLKICFIISEDISTAIFFMFTTEDFFKFAISFSVAAISFSNSSLNFCFLISISLSNFFLLSSKMFLALFLDSSIAILYSSSFFSALSFNF